MLSELSHANLLGSVSRVQEIDLGDKKLLRKYHFGGYRNERWLALQFKTLLVLMLIALTTVLPPAYVPHMEDAEGWWQRVQRLPERLRELGVDIAVEPTSAPLEGEVYQRVAQKLRVSHVLFSSEQIDESMHSDSEA